MNKISKFVVSISMVIFLTGNINASDEVLYDVHLILYRENIDLDAKSLKGWIRVFNSNSKLREYEISVTIEERERVLLFLKEKYKKENNKYAKVVR